MSDLLLIPILDVEEEKRTGHDHSQDGKGGEDVVERQGDLTKLLQDDGLVFGGSDPRRSVAGSEMVQCPDQTPESIPA